MAIHLIKTKAMQDEIVGSDLNSLENILTLEDYYQYNSVFFKRKFAAAKEFYQLERANHPLRLQQYFSSLTMGFYLQLNDLNYPLNTFMSRDGLITSIKYFNENKALEKKNFNLIIPHEFHGLINEENFKTIYYYKVNRNLLSNFIQPNINKPDVLILFGTIGQHAEKMVQFFEELALKINHLVLTYPSIHTLFLGINDFFTEDTFFSNGNRAESLNLASDFISHLKLKYSHLEIKFISIDLLKNKINQKSLLLSLDPNKIMLGDDSIVHLGLSVGATLECLKSKNIADGLSMVKNIRLSPYHVIEIYQDMKTVNIESFIKKIEMQGFKNINLKHDDYLRLANIFLKGNS